MRALPISRTARRRFGLDARRRPAARRARPAPRPGGLAADIPAARQVAAAVNATRRAGEPSAQAGELAALELLHEIFHLLVVQAAELVPAPRWTPDRGGRGRVGEPVLDDLLDAVGEEFPDVDDRPTPVRLEELLLIRLANENPAARPLRDLVDDTPLPAEARDGDDGRARGLPGRPDADRAQRRDAGRAPARAGPRPPDVARRPAALRPRALARPAGRRARRAARPAAAHARRHRRGGARAPPPVRRRRRRRRGGGRGEAPDLSGLDAEPERFSSDSAWMPRLVLIAKSTHVWLDQLSRRYGRDIRTLDAIPDEELDRLARWGDHRPVADRAVGAQPGVATDQGLARQPGRGGVGLLARRLPRSPTTSAARRPGRTCAAGPGSAASGSPRTWCPTTWASTRAGSSSTRSGSCRCPSRPTPATRSAARTSPRTTGSRSGSRTTTGTTATRRSCSSGATAGRASGATSTTATTARASRGTTRRSSTSARRRSGSR